VDPEILDSATGKIKIPRTFGEALRRSDKEWWLKAWFKEADALDTKACYCETYMVIQRLLAPEGR